MLSRVSALPSISNAAQARRAISTLPALRFHASTRSCKDDQRDRISQVLRSNPIVGANYVPPAQTPKPAAAQPSSAVSSNPNKSRDEFIPPPPPPPLPTSTTASSSSSSPANPTPTQAEKNAKSGKSSAYRYNAADPSSDPLSNLIIEDISEILSQKSSAFGHSLGMGDPLTRPKVRTKAVTGRTVFIADRLTPTSAPTPIVAIRVLERMCREQKVRNKFHSQKFHERKGLKKKRLRSERWRARFKVGFKAAVSKVMELKKQGW